MRAASRSPFATGYPARRSTGTAVRVECYRESYFRRLFNIETNVFEADRYSLDLFRRLCYENSDLLLVARAGNRCIGYVMGEFTQPGAEVVSLAVAPPYRSQGVGRRLLRRLLLRLSEFGIGRVFLMVREGNEAAIHLYRSFGFRRVRRIPDYYSDGEAAIRMRLELN